MISCDIGRSSAVGDKRANEMVKLNCYKIETVCDIPRNKGRSYCSFASMIVPVSCCSLLLLLVWSPSNETNSMVGRTGRVMFASAHLRQEDLDTSSSILKARLNQHWRSKHLNKNEAHKHHHHSQHLHSRHHHRRRRSHHRAANESISRLAGGLDAHQWTGKAGVVAHSSREGQQQRPTLELEYQLEYGQRDLNAHQAPPPPPRTTRGNGGESILEREKRFFSKHNKRHYLISTPTKDNLLDAEQQANDHRERSPSAPRHEQRPLEGQAGDLRIKSLDNNETLEVQAANEKMSPPATTTTTRLQTTRDVGGTANDAEKEDLAHVEREHEQPVAGRAAAAVPYDAPDGFLGPVDADEPYYLYIPASSPDLLELLNRTDDEQLQQLLSLNKQNLTSGVSEETKLASNSTGQQQQRQPNDKSRDSRNATAKLQQHQHANEQNRRNMFVKKQYPYHHEVHTPFCLGHHQTETLFTWECQGYQLREVPDRLDPKPNSLRLSKTGLEVLPSNALNRYSETLRDISIENSPRLTRIEPNSFKNLTKLRVVYIFRAHRLKNFDLAIAGKHSDLTIIRIQQTGLTTWPDLSQFEQEKILNSIDLDNNQIKTLGSKPINIRAELVNLEFNLIATIEEFTFNGSEIAVLSLSGNRLLTSIHLNAFANLKNLIKLDLSGTSLSQLPTAGLHQLRSLVIKDNYLMRQIPSIYVFPMLEEAHLTYAHHCCSFRYPQTHDPSAYEEHIQLQAEINSICSKRMLSAPSPSEPSAAATTSPAAVQRRRRLASYDDDFGYSPTGPPPQLPPLFPPNKQASEQSDSDFEGSFSEHKHDSGTLPAAGAARPNESASNSSGGGAGQSSLTKQWLLQNIECGELVMKPNATRSIACTPEPDAFNPCEDIMGYSVLRVAVWFVVAASICGNLSVIVVLLGIFNRLSVPKFLQLNLAIGDLFMGVYLALLAVADLTTVGTYFNHAIDWQLGLGCQVAGASSLFASQLSIFTLSVITFERYYTITYSIDLNMRLQLGWAARIMLFGWVYAFASAMLPIFANINSYSKTSICLPLRAIYPLDRVFIIVLLIVDSSVFLIIFVCYLKMYLLILRQKTEATLKERTVAMRMALLVFTDFACWAPIIFFGATAVMGYPLISVTNSKILIVFFYPLNSMANPFLYVISTRQYRRDLNYVLSRWQHWRKNLFKKKVDQTNFYNLANNPYGLPGHQYPAGLNAQLNAVAAVTGVADHLRHYKLDAHHHHHHNHNGATCDHNHLVRISNGSTGTNHNHNHHQQRQQNCIDSDSNTQENNAVLRIHEQRLALNPFKGSSPSPAGRNHGGGSSCQFIIRHQILTSKHASAGVRNSNETTTTSALTNCNTRRRLLEKINSDRQRQARGNIAETSEEINSSQVDNVKNVLDDDNLGQTTGDKNVAQKGLAKHSNEQPTMDNTGGGSKGQHLSCRRAAGQQKCCSSKRQQTGTSSSQQRRRSNNCQECRPRADETTGEQTTRAGKRAARRRKCNHHHHECSNKLLRDDSRQSKACKSHHRKKQTDPKGAVGQSLPEQEPTTTTTATSELTTTSADALLLPGTFEASPSMVCVCSIEAVDSNHQQQQQPSISDERTSSSGVVEETKKSGEQHNHRHHRHHHRHRHHHHHRDHGQRIISKCKSNGNEDACPLGDNNKAAKQHKSDELLAANHLRPESNQLADCRPQSDDGIHRQPPARQQHGHHHHHRRQRRGRECDGCCKHTHRKKSSHTTDKASSCSKICNNTDDSSRNDCSGGEPTTRLNKFSSTSKITTTKTTSSSVHSGRRLECNLKPVIECANDADELQNCASLGDIR